MIRRLILALALLFGITALAQAQYSPIPIWNGQAFPTPPQQAAPWTTPSVTLSAGLITACKVLFQQGLPDPRGCEYREITWQTYEMFGSQDDEQPEYVRTHGWVLPGTKGAQRFAICWDGVIYPVTTIGAPANLAKDVQVMTGTGKIPLWSGVLMSQDEQALERDGETKGYDWHALSPIRVCLLLRLGQGELAQQVWKSWTADKPADYCNNAVYLKDPYLVFAEDWVTARYGRLVNAHGQGEDALALADARALYALLTPVETTAAKHGFPRPASDNPQAAPGPYLEVFAKVPALLADQERRAHEKTKLNPNEVTPAKYPNQAERITALIASLEEEISVDTDQRDALVQEGEAAVEPLLACLKTDTRLTRNVSYGLPPEVVPVYKEAQADLLAIMQTNDEELGATLANDADLPTRAAYADTLRNFWQNMAHKSQPERWYATLANDHATTEQWMLAAQSIVGMAMHQHQTDPTLPGESLRQQHDPTVTDLLVKRFNAFCQQQINGEVPPANGHPAAEVSTTIPLDYALRTLFVLDRWDAKEESALLPTLVPSLKAAYQALEKNSEAQQSHFLEVLQWRMAIQDQSAFTEYAHWLHTTETPWNNMRDLWPLYNYAENPQMRELAVWFFTDQASPWMRHPVSNWRNDLGNVPLLYLPVVRQVLLQQLDDRKEMGKVEISADRKLRFTTEPWSMAQPSLPDGEPLPEKAQRVIAFRVCDVVANALGDRFGFPACELYWPPARRDAAIAADARLLKQYGACFLTLYGRADLVAAQSYFPQNLWMGSFCFAPLDHPATLQDVQQGRAIFSLPENVQKRITATAMPQLARRISPANEKTAKDQQGLIVWQYEEALEEGKWVGYCGVEGPHELSKVPAAQLELLNADDRWTRLPNGLEFQLRSTGATEITAGQPVPALEVRFRNSRFVPVDAPVTCVTQQGERMAVGGEFSLRVWYAAPERVKLGAYEMDHLTPRQAPVTLASVERKPLAPCEERSGGSFDVRKCYDLSRPGEYSVEFVYRVNGKEYIAHARFVILP